MKIGPLQLAALVFGHLVVPCTMLIGLARSGQEGGIEWAVAAVGAGSFITFMFLVGRWDWFGYGLRYAFAGAAAVTLVWSFPGAEPGSWAPAPIFDAPSWWVEVVVALFLLGLATSAALRRRPSGSVDLVFPLRGVQASDRFYVAHGGASTWLNYHASHEAQRYALDIVKLGRFGRRARGLYPRDPTSYEIWGTEVIAPCSGVVVSAVDGLADLEPPHLDPANRAGNHVVIRAEHRSDCFVVLAHLRKGSVRVAQGVRVRAGDPLGEVGNTGNSTEPHLHVHACVDCTDSDYPGTGRGLPVTFSGRFLVRNHLVRGTGPTPDGHDRPHCLREDA